MNAHTTATHQKQNQAPGAAAPSHDEAPQSYWQLLQSTIGNAAVARMHSVQRQDQALAENPTPVDKATQARISSSKGNGAALRSDVQRDMRGEFGPQVGAVRVHDGVEAGAMARGLHARAFTQGSDVFFAPGQYQPDTAAGRNVIAHELTHVTRGREQVGVVHCVGEDVPLPYGPGESAAQDEGPQQSRADPGGGVSSPAEHGASEGADYREMVGGEIYVGNTNIEWELGGNTMVVTVPINFTGRPPAARWFPEIRRVWNVFEIVDTESGIRIDLSFVPQTDSGGYRVNVRRGMGRANENNWYLGDTSTNTAPHEFGHMLGLQDEYQVTREHYVGITGQEAPEGDQGEAGANPADVAADLWTAISTPGADQAQRVHAVVSNNGIEQGDFAQRILRRYDADHGSLLQDLARLRRAGDPDSHIYSTIEAFTYTSGSIMGGMGEGDAIDHDHGAEARHIRRFAQIVQQARPNGHWRAEERR